MRVLVTGGSGFVGSHLVDFLLQRGHSVRCLVRPTSSLEFLPVDAVELVRGDLTDAATLEAALHEVDAVAHLAAVLRARSDAGYRAVNVEGTLALYRAFALQDRQGARFLFCSSLAAAGPAPDRRPRREEDAPRPSSAYGRSKLAAERALAAADGPPLIVIRPPAVYGPRDRGILPFFRLARRGCMPVVGDRQRPVSLIHVGDLVEGMALALESPRAAGGIWYLTGGAPHRWCEVAEALARSVGRRARTVVIPDGLVRMVGAVSEALLGWRRRPPLLTREKAGDLTADAWICTSEAAQRAWGFRPQVALGPGMEQTAAWYREAGWL